MIKRLGAVLLLFLVLACAAFAVEPDEIMADPRLEARARDISSHLRCMVCQNQSIDDSSAGLARDLRLLVRERIAAGQSDAEVLDYVVSRYSEFILLKPRFEFKTLLLWLTPMILLLSALAFMVIRHFNPSRPRTNAILSELEEARLKHILQDDAFEN